MLLLKLTGAHWGTHQLKIKENTVAGVKLLPFEQDPMDAPYELPCMSPQKLSELRLKIEVSDQKIIQEILPQ